MKQACLFFVSVLLSIYEVQGQIPVPGHDPFPQLDSIGRSNSIGKHFGVLYHEFLSRIENQLSHRDSAAQHLVRRFEIVFASFFIEACKSHEANQPVRINEWQAYFQNEDLQPIQYKLLGANAHLNGGLWHALTNSFSREEMDQLREEFVIFKKSLNTTYKQVYREALAENRKIQAFGNISIGIPQWMGNYYLYKWRKRQMKLARLYWSGSPRLASLQAKVDRKKIKIDRMIRSGL